MQMEQKMYVTMGLPSMAPQTTGHPAGLPAEPPAAQGDQEVTPVSEKSDTADAQLRQDTSDQSAPPSAIQRKIMELLERQATEEGDKG